MKEVGEVVTVGDMEQVIGILSYVRRTVKDVEKILGPLQKDLKILKKGKVTEKWKNEMNQRVGDAFSQALVNLQWLAPLGMEADEYMFIIESDWSSGHSGYILFVHRGCEERLVDLGSKAHGRVTSSYLGELETIL